MPDQPALPTLCFLGKLGQLPPVNEVCGKAMFLHMSLIPRGSASGGRGVSAYRGIDWADLRPPATRKVGGMHPTGMLSCSKEYGPHVDSEFHACHFSEGVRNNTST